MFLHRYIIEEVLVKLATAFSGKLFHHQSSRWLEPFLHKPFISNLAKNGCFIKSASGHEKLISRHTSVAGVNALKEAHVTP